MSRPEPPTTARGAHAHLLKQAATRRSWAAQSKPDFSDPTNRYAAHQKDEARKLIGEAAMVRSLSMERALAPMRDRSREPER